jgi:plastocyanin
MSNKFITGTIVAVIATVGIGAALLARTPESPKSDHSSSMNTQKSNDSKEAVQNSDQVTYKDFSVVQEKITVKKGTTVTWTNEDSAKHDVTPDSETSEFKASPLFGKGETHKVTFKTPGTYTYYCSPHPYMKGTVEVTE